MRLSSIAIDSQGLAPPQWSGAWVQRRLIEAYAVERRLPQQRQRHIGTIWPTVSVEWADLLGRADTARAEVLQSWEFAPVAVSANDITRMDEAQDWLRVILRDHHQERLCLGYWAAAIAYGRSVRRLLLQRRWSRSSFYRRVEAGAHVVAMELRRKNQPVV